MKEIIWKPELHRFSSCKEFVEEFRLGASDLILTNEYIYQPYFGAMNLECAVLYQEQYGMGEPTDVMAEAILRDAAATGCSRVVAIGGGTVIDMAKVLAVGGGESIDELYGMAPELPKRRELVLIPTTCGTGSEVTMGAVISDHDERHKYAIMDPNLVPKYAVLDPKLTVSMPKFVTATTGIDALTHAVESYVTWAYNNNASNRNAEEAVVKIFRNLKRAYEDGNDLEAREAMLIASYKAGLAFNHTGVGYVHAIAHAMGGTGSRTRSSCRLFWRTTARQSIPSLRILRRLPA